MPRILHEGSDPCGTLIKTIASHTNFFLCMQDRKIWTGIAVAGS